MKKNYFSLLLVIGVLIMGLMVSCTKEGPAGPAGADGTNGTNGTDGTDGTAGCVECHDDNQTISLKAFQWERSAHAAGNALSRAGSASCSPCHSVQGFFISDGNNPETTDTWEGVSDPLPITCYACHPIHTSYTDQDTKDLNFSGQPNWAVTYGKDVDMDLGKGNTCAHCHQSRTREPVVDMNDLSIIYSGISTHYGPHYSSQSNLLGGFGAYELEGSAVYPASNYHLSADDGCVSCHMRFDTPSGSGGHSWHIEASSDLEVACAQCHSSGAEAPGKYEEYYHEVFATIDHDGDDPTVNTTSYYTMLGDALVDHGVYTKVIDSVGGFPEAVHYNINRNIEINGTLTAAMFNHRFLYQDHSHGVHNPGYAKALLKNSLESVDALN